MKHVVVQAQNQDIMQDLVLCVGVMVRLDLVKDFSLFNKLVLNAQVLEKKLHIHVLHVVDKGKNRLVRDYLLLFLRVLTMEQE